MDGFCSYSIEGVEQRITKDGYGLDKLYACRLIAGISRTRLKNSSDIVVLSRIEGTGILMRIVSYVGGSILDEIILSDKVASIDDILVGVSVDVVGCELCS